MSLEPAACFCSVAVVPWWEQEHCCSNSRRSSSKITEHDGGQKQLGCSWLMTDIDRWLFVSDVLLDRHNVDNADNYFDVPKAFMGQEPGVRIVRGQSTPLIPLCRHEADIVAYWVRTAWMLMLLCRLDCQYTSHIRPLEPPSRTWSISLRYLFLFEFLWCVCISSI